MKFVAPSRFDSRETPVHPGFDVLMAVTGARQASSPTARILAARAPGAADKSAAKDFSRRCELLTTGRLTSAGEAPGPGRFADVAIVPTTEANANADADARADAPKEMNGPFTTAFQPMVKHQNIYPKNDGERPDGDGQGME